MVCVGGLYRLAIWTSLVVGGLGDTPDNVSSRLMVHVSDLVPT